VWTEEDRAYALAWQDYSRDTCGGCGQQLTVSTAREHQFAYEGEPVRCHACATQHRIVAKFSKDGGDTDGVMVRMTRRP
jgi:hypothetical protein